jgi:hypothetical protein
VSSRVGHYEADRAGGPRRLHTRRRGFARGLALSWIKVRRRRGALRAALSGKVNVGPEPAA